MTGLAPTASAVRYLDLSDQWYKLPAGSRDQALDYLERGRQFCFLNRSKWVKVTALKFCINRQKGEIFLTRLHIIIPLASDSIFCFRRKTIHDLLKMKTFFFSRIFSYF